MISDLKFALRQLGKAPGFTLVALLTLALGIGVNTSMYTLVDVLLFRSAPFPDQERMVFVQGTTSKGQPDGFAFAETDELRAQAKATFESFTTFSGWDNTLVEPGRPAERLHAIDATADFFTTFGVQPMLGRAYTAEEEVPGRNQVAILSYALWQSRFGGDPGVIGRTIQLNAEAVTVIGVMPASFTYPLFWGKMDLYRPITIPPQVKDDRNNHFFAVAGRLKAGVTRAQAKAQLDPVLARWAKDDPSRNAGRGVRLMALHEATMDSTSRFIVWLLFGVGAVVLLIACFNIANLQLARAAANTRDLAIRSALGASRARLIVHQLVESLVLGLGGGVVGLLVGAWANDLIGRSIHLGDPGTTLALPMNGRVFAEAFAAALVSGLLAGLVPAWLASRGDMVTTLKQQTRGSTAGRASHRLRHSLVVAEVALALALLATAGVMIRGFRALLQRDQGWDTVHVLAANIHLPEQSVYQTEDSRRLAIEKLARRLTQIPHAEHTGICSTTPLFDYSKTWPIEVQGQTSDDPAKQPIAGYTMVGSDYFQALGIPLREGRYFPAELKADSPPLAIINETMARHFWPKESAIGKRFGDRSQNNTLVWREVIGVVRDVHFQLNLANPSTMFQVYKPLVNEPWGYLWLLVRGPAPVTFKSEVLKAVADVDPNVAVQEIFTMPEAADYYAHNIVVINDTMGGFALLGLALAAIGLYGVISNLVAQRTAEFGIRLALGAKPRDVLGLVLRRGVGLTLLGLVIGAALAYALNLALQASMPRMAASDPVTITLVALVLLMVALLACWLPARRATKVDPVIALRAE